MVAGAVHVLLLSMYLAHRCLNFCERAEPFRDNVWYRRHGHQQQSSSPFFPTNVRHHPVGASGGDSELRPKETRGINVTMPRRCVSRDPFIEVSHELRNIVEATFKCHNSWDNDHLTPTGVVLAIKAAFVVAMRRTNRTKAAATSEFESYVLAALHTRTRFPFRCKRSTHFIFSSSYPD